MKPYFSNRQETTKMADFASLLSKRVDTTERPKLIPPGTYQSVVQGHEFGESARKRTPYVRFSIQPITPEPDVDQELLQAFGGVAKLREKSLRVDFFLTEDAMYRLREFLENHLRLNSNGRSYDQVIPEAKGRALKVQVAHEISQDAKSTYANVVATLPA